MASIEARTRQPLNILVKKLGTGEHASWDITKAFLTNTRVTSRPILPARSEEENLANPYPHWPPKPAGQTEDEWARQYEILGQYASGTDQIEKKHDRKREKKDEDLEDSHQEDKDQTDEEHGVSREFVRQKKDRALVGLWRALPPKVQEKYPLENLETGRPVQDETRKRNSNIQFQRRGISKRIGKLVDEGTSVKKIIFEEGERRVIEARRILRERGTTVPYVREGVRTPQAVYESRRALRSGEWDTKKTQEYLDGLSGSQLRKLFKSHDLTSLARLTQDAGIQGYNRGNKLEAVTGLLKQMGTVVGVSKPYHDKTRGRDLIHYGVLTQKTDEVRELLESEAFDALRKPNSTLVPVSRGFENRFNGVKAS